MASVHATTLTGATAVLDDEAISDFRQSLRGPLLQSGDDGFEAARHIWNGMIDRTPALIARCAGAADVVRAVAFAREHGLTVAVRAGGHSAAGSAVCFFHPDYSPPVIVDALFADGFQLPD